MTDQLHRVEQAAARLVELGAPEIARAVSDRARRDQARGDREGRVDALAGEIEALIELVRDALALGGELLAKAERVEALALEVRERLRGLEGAGGS